MEEERVKKFIKAYEEIKEQSFITANINKDFFLEFAECLIKRIKELEEENVILRKANNITGDLIKEVKIEDITQVINKSYEEFVNQFIPKQKVTDKLKEDIEKTKEQIKHYERQYKTAKEKEDKFHIKSFHRQINRWQSRFETLREILNIIEGGKK